MSIPSGNGRCSFNASSGGAVRRLKHQVLNDLLLLAPMAIIGIAAAGISSGFFGWP
jgi:hypothetical protein